jgi:hypothetical protein
VKWEGARLVRRMVSPVPPGRARVPARREGGLEANKCIPSLTGEGYGFREWRIARIRRRQTHWKKMPFRERLCRTVSDPSPRGNHFHILNRSRSAWSGGCACSSMCSCLSDIASSGASNVHVRVAKSNPRVARTDPSSASQARKRSMVPGEPAGQLVI